MAEFSWMSEMRREDVAGLLRRIADGLDGDGRLRLQQDVAELKVDVPERIEVSVELDVETERLQVELELGWPLAPQARGPESASGADATGASRGTSSDSAE